MRKPLRISLTQILCSALLCLCPHPAAAQEHAPQLSFFEDQGAKCLWQKMAAPSGEKKLLASFERACLGAWAVVNTAQTHALVWFNQALSDGPSFGGSLYEDFPKSSLPQQSAEGITSALWLIDLKSGKALSIPLPTEAQLETFKLDDGGRVWAYTVEDAALEWQEPDWDRLRKTKKFKFKGKEYDFPSPSGEGAPAVASALRWSDAAKQWDMVEHLGTHTGWDYALGVRVLKNYSGCCGNTALDGSNIWREIEASALPLKSLAPKLKGFQPGKDKDSGEWRYLAPENYDSAFKVAVWGVSFEFMYNTGLFLFFKNEEILVPEQRLYEASDLPLITFDSKFMLITTPGLRTHPRMYDLDAAKLSFSADALSGVSFWSQLVLKKEAAEAR